MSHSLTKLLFHCVFSTKDRRQILKGNISEKVNAYIHGIAKNCEMHLIRAGGTADHRHLLLELPPTTNICDAVRLIKANSSKWLHENYPELNGFGWQIGYAAFTVSESVRDKVTSYIDGQEEHHRNMNFGEELVMILKKHGVDYDINMNE